MSENTEINVVEAKILDVAKAMFIEKGFAETSMSGIAAKAGINRPVLHYYFRTKEKMFDAVFGGIIQSVVPKIQNIIQNKSMPVAERISEIVDTYYKLYEENPYIPMFIITETHRNTDFMVQTVQYLGIKDSFDKAAESLQEEMAEGKLKTVPMNIIFLSFFGLLTFPFLSKDLTGRLFMDKDKTFDMLINEWKPYIVSHMEHLLCIDK